MGKISGSGRKDLSKACLKRGQSYKSVAKAPSFREKPSFWPRWHRALKDEAVALADTYFFLFKELVQDILQMSQHFLGSKLSVKRFRYPIFKAKAETEFHTYEDHEDLSGSSRDEQWDSREGTHVKIEDQKL